MKTFVETTKGSEEKRKWVLVDAADKVVGRVASEIAAILRGKHKPTFTAHIDTGDFVVVVNASKVKFTRSKAENKIYYKHTGFIGNIKRTVAADMLAKKPEEVITMAVKGMLPKSALGRQQISKLKVYSGAEHPHQAQRPEVLSQ